MKPYVFGHREASGNEIENTISAFKKVIIMGVGIDKIVNAIYTDYPDKLLI
jgi:glycerophosphoryl diester phosphodiesterase